MLEQFAECGLGNGNLLPRQSKTLFWNIDFFLDLNAAAIVGLYIIRSPERLEDSLAKWLEQDPHTQVIERGLGANDVPGNTHLLHVCADESWWRSLPAELANMIEDGS